MISIFQTLEQIGATSKETRVLYNMRTSDINNLKVWKDSYSGVVYIDDFYTGDKTYVEGSYREAKEVASDTGNSHFERYQDANRRFASNQRLVSGKKIADFGCGNGDFLKLMRSHCTSIIGIELQSDFIKNLNDEGIPCTNDIHSINDNSLDVIVSFHVIEHLPQPIETLTALRDKLVSGGQILIEVPHANDFLLSVIQCEQFKQFTLWSQHLVLHTRESLRRLLQHVGFEEIQIEGVQRYPLSNHLSWIATGKPGGHKSQLASLDSNELRNAYENSLARLDATDTLVAIAKAP